MKRFITSLFRTRGIHVSKEPAFELSEEDIERSLLEYDALENAARTRRTAGAARFSHEKKLIVADAMRKDMGLSLPKWRLRA